MSPLAARASADPPSQEKRHHEVVRDGDREREAVEHHHAGSGGNSADHREQRQPVRAGGERQRQNRQVAVDPAVREHLQACNCERDHEEVDQNEIEREEPRGRAHAALVVVLNDRDMELPRQENDGEGRQERGDAPNARIRPRLDDRGDPRIRLRRLSQVANAAVETPHDEGADRQKRDELDDRLDGDRKNEAVLMLLRIDAPRAEGDGEGRERQRDRERDRGRRRARRQPAVVERRHDRQQRRRDRLELKRDVRRGPDERDERRDRRGRLRLAVARRHEIGDRGQVLRARKFGDPSDKRRAEADDEDRANIDRQKIESMLRREADRAVIGPRRAIDREAERIDDRARAAGRETPPSPVSPPGDEEQEGDIGDRGEKDRRAVHRAERSPFRVLGDTTGRRL